jgi:hypothetical protein
VRSRFLSTLPLAKFVDNHQPSRHLVAGQSASDEILTHVQREVCTRPSIMAAQSRPLPND